MNTRAIGIDLGTTNTVVASINAGGHTEIMRTGEGESLIPSVVLFSDERTIVGREAELRGRKHADRLAACAKQSMGQTSYDHLIGGELLPPEIIQACILQQANREFLGQDDRQCRVVIAVPAHFNETQRHATAMAAEIAGLHLLDLVNEPIAAALAFAEDAPLFSIAENHGGPRAVLVFDLGGHTFEATLLSIRPGEVTMVATDHDSLLGGHQWDLRLVDLLAESFIRRHGIDLRDNPQHLDQLMQRAIQVKYALGAHSHASVHLSCDRLSQTISISRTQFEDATDDLVERTGSLCDRLLQQAGVGWPRVSQVLLVGGATRMPMIRRILAERLGRPVDDRVCPEEAVARGAAIYATQAMNGQRKPPPLQVTSISTHSLGIEGVDQRTGERTNKILIRKGTPLPAKVTREFPCKANSHRTIVFNVLEGEAAEPSACAKIGVVVLRDLPADIADEWPVDVTYEYSQSGRLSVEAKVRYTDCSVHLETVRPAGVSKAHIAQWKKAVTALAGFPAFRNVRVWEQAVEAPGPLAVAGLAKSSALEHSRVQAFLRRVIPWAKI